MLPQFLETQIFEHFPAEEIHFTVHSTYHQFTLAHEIMWLRGMTFGMHLLCEHSAYCNYGKSRINDSWYIRTQFWQFWMQHLSQSLVNRTVLWSTTLFWMEMRMDAPQLTHISTRPQSHVCRRLQRATIRWE